MAEAAGGTAAAAMGGVGRSLASEATVSGAAVRVEARVLDATEGATAVAGSEAAALEAVVTEAAVVVLSRGAEAMLAAAREQG